MKSNDESWMAFLDPEFSVLELSSGLHHRDVHYLDVVTGWQASSDRVRWPRRVGNPASLRREVEASLRRLKVERCG